MLLYLSQYNTTYLDSDVEIKDGIIKHIYVNDGCLVYDTESNKIIEYSLVRLLNQYIEFLGLSLNNPINRVIRVFDNYSVYISIKPIRYYSNRVNISLYGELYYHCSYNKSTEDIFGLFEFHHRLIRIGKTWYFLVDKSGEWSENRYFNRNYDKIFSIVYKDNGYKCSIYNSEIHLPLNIDLSTIKLKSKDLVNVKDIGNNFKYFDDLKRWFELDSETYNNLKDKDNSIKNLIKVVLLGKS